MAEYIEREAAKKEFNLNFGGVSHAVIANRILDAIPAADVAPVVHGRWEESVVIQTDTSTLYDYTCSECSIVTSRGSNYCPNCGARMEGE